MLEFVLRSLVVSLALMAFGLIAGIGSNVVTIVTFGLGLLAFVTLGLYAVVWVLVGAVYRRLND